MHCGVGTHLPQERFRRHEPAALSVPELPRTQVSSVTVSATVLCGYCVGPPASVRPARSLRQYTVRLSVVQWRRAAHVPLATCHWDAATGTASGSG